MSLLMLKEPRLLVRVQQQEHTFLAGFKPRYFQRIQSTRKLGSLDLKMWLQEMLDLSILLH